MRGGEERAECERRLGGELAWEWWERRVFQEVVKRCPPRPSPRARSCPPACPHAHPKADRRGRACAI